jgi:hypothetical protein
LRARLEKRLKFPLQILNFKIFLFQERLQKAENNTARKMKNLKMLEMTNFAILLFSYFPTVLCANAKMHENQTDIYSDQVSNGTAYSFNETSNKTAYQCQGASKEDLRAYENLAWWMDAVCQVSLKTFTVDF